MNELGICYKKVIGKTVCEIRQIDNERFRLLIDENNQGDFASAENAREQVKALEAAGETQASRRNEVPLLGDWETFPNDLFDPEKD